MIKIRFQRNIWKIFIIIPITLLSEFSTLITLFTEGGLDYRVEELIADTLFGLTKIGDIKSYALVLDGMYYILIFTMLFGTYIYHDFTISSIYLFSRMKDRKKWFYRKVVEISLLALSYTFLFLTTLALVCSSGSKYKMNSSAWILLLVLFFLITLFLIGTVLLINLIAIRTSSAIGFLSIYTALLVCIMIVLHYHQSPFIVQHPYFMLFDPVYGIILNLSNDLMMRSVSFIYYILLDLAIIWFGMRFIKNLEVGLIHAELKG